MASILNDHDREAILSSATVILKRQENKIAFNALRHSKKKIRPRTNSFSGVQEIIMELHQSDQEYIIDEGVRMMTERSIEEVINQLHNSYPDVKVNIKPIPEDTGAHRSNNPIESYITNIAIMVDSRLQSKVFRKIVERLVQAIRNKDNDLAIGEAKSLLESFAKHILDINEMPNFPPLIKNCINSIYPNSITSPEKNKPQSKEEVISTMLSTLFKLALSVNNLRHFVGTGHGGGPRKDSVDERYVRLSAGATAVFMDFILASKLPEDDLTT